MRTVEVRQPHDPLELEADRMADRVVGNQAHQPIRPLAGKTETAEPMGGGEPLDERVRATMEPRFGHDFSAVRIHADEGAAESAATFGARAYTLDNDIVFGRAAYAPETSEGRHLLAHELAHVVQQGDGRSAGPAGAVMRVPAGDMAAVADEAAEEEKKNLTRKPPIVDQINNIGDVSRAAQTRNEIIGYRPAMAKGKSDGDIFITEEQWGDNENAVQVLDHYVNDARVQGTTLGDFQSQFDKLMVDYTRLVAEVRMYGETKQGKGTDAPEDNADVAKAQIASTGKNTDQLQADFRKANTSNSGSGNTSTEFESAHQFLQQMHNESMNVATTESAMASAQMEATAAAENLVAVLGEQKAATMQGKVDELKAKAAEAKEQVALVGKFVKTAVSLGTAAATGGVEAGEAANQGTELASAVAEYVASKAYDEDIKNIKRDLDVVKAEVAEARINEAINKAAAAKGRYIDTCKEYINANKRLEDAKNEYRRAMQVMGASADTATGAQPGTRFEVIAQLLSEADAFLAQADATITIGDHEVDQSKVARKSAAGVQNKEKDQKAGVVDYWRPYQWYTQGTLSYQATKLQFRLSLTGEGETHPGSSAEGEKYGVNPVMDRAIAELKKSRTEIVKYADVLRQVFNTKAPTTK